MHSLQSSGGLEELIGHLTIYRLYKYLKVCRPPDISPTDLRHGHANAQEGGFTGPEQNA